MYTYIVSFFFIICLSSCAHVSNKYEYITIQGTAQGTYYRIVLQSNNQTYNIEYQIDSVLQSFDSLFNNYIDFSLISRINTNDTSVQIHPQFAYFWKKSVDIWSKTNGAFDISIAPIINAWKFGFKEDSLIPTPEKISELLKLKGMNKMGIRNNRFYKENPQMQIISNAIAQGYSVDIVCCFLDSRNIQNYLVDIGGEMKAKGLNAKGEVWNIGITKPVQYVDSLPIEQSYICTYKLENKSLATSGNYRKFYIKNGVTYSHTINPETGYPVRHELLSATVVADECIDADAVATACMVMGLEKSKQFFEKHKKYSCILLYSIGDSIAVYTTFDKKDINMQ
ncbi:MAG: Thiamine biosynthesis lipoprotein ApbE precursor [Bacteroidetes bacterium ADurb.Bin217]|nr:MAG: Thiamine biosynthesis lipoprotein ApbE precursor [Bacteroidetes bacterium ADurb.Bin217]